MILCENWAVSNFFRRQADRQAGRLCCDGRCVGALCYHWSSRVKISIRSFCCDISIWGLFVMHCCGGGTKVGVKCCQAASRGKWIPAEKRIDDFLCFCHEVARQKAQLYFSIRDAPSSNIREKNCPLFDSLGHIIHQIHPDEKKTSNTTLYHSTYPHNPTNPTLMVKKPTNYTLYHSTHLHNAQLHTPSFRWKIGQDSDLQVIVLMNFFSERLTKWQICAFRNKTVQDSKRKANKLKSQSKSGLESWDSHRITFVWRI